MTEATLLSRLSDSEASVPMRREIELVDKRCLLSS
jgi:hypothetical protein